MSRTMKSIVWAAHAGGGLLILVGVWQAVWPHAVQAYLEREPAASASKERGRNKSVNIPSTVLARLTCTRLNAKMFVFPDGAKNLMMGPVALTPTPSQSFRGNSVIAAHRDLHFRFLKDVRIGDEFRVQSRDGEYKFKVEELSIVEISNRTLLMPSSDRVLTLVTCYPFYYVGSAPQRFIVRATLIEGAKRQLLTDLQ